MNSPFNKKILVGKIEEAFSLEKGNVEEYKKYTKEYGQCMLCEKFRKNNRWHIIWRKSKRKFLFYAKYSL